MTKSMSLTCPEKTWPLAIAAALLFCGLSSCREPNWQAHPLDPEVAFVTTKHRREYTLSVGDMLDVIVINQETLSRSCEIRLDGYISLPLLDDVKAAGLTPTQLDEKLTELLSTRLRDPEVTVIATSLRPPSAMVVGEVLRSTVVALRDAPTAAEAIAIAGGFTNKSAERSVILLRTTDDGQCMGMKVDVSGLKGQSAPFLALRGLALQPGDIIFVPKNPGAQLSRFLELYVNNVMSTVNTGLSTYTQLRWLEVLEKQLDQLDNALEARPGP